MFIKIKETRRLRNRIFTTIIAVLFFFGSAIDAHSEGTKQWMPTGMVAGQELSLGLFNTPDGNDRLGTTGCSADERINIRISSNFANEVIYIGMNKFETDASFFRVMDPNGNQVYPASVGTLQAVLGDGPGLTGEGYIANLTEARNGPEEVFGAGGFDAISITPTMAGDYYIEFNGANSTTYSAGNKHQISYFDVTVANTNGLPEGLGNHTAIDGRLNAFQWSLYNLTDGSGFNLVDAEFFLYQSDDSLVIAVQWDQVKAGGWNIAFTRDGVQATGDYFTDRQSQPYTAVGKGSVVGEFPIFVSPPDTAEYPSASELPKLNFLEYDRCSGSTCFIYNITKGGQVEILIDLNENGTFDPGTSDRLLVDNKPAGTHCLAWDDLDGLGDLVVAGQAQAVIKYQAGIFHMPLGDVEANSNGFDRTLVRPLSFLVEADSGRIYYDHTEAGGAFGAADFDFEGVTSAGNIWTPDDGNQLYLNTWFSFAELRDTLIVTFNSCDKDDDGLSDVLDIDDDNDGIPDIVEMYNGDHDGDGTLDYEDAQFCTATFAGVNGWDCADGLPDPSDDLDGDGIRNALDSDFPGCGSTLSGACAGYDSDLDGIPDYLDRDSDNDGISDLIEIGGVDTDGNGVIDDLTDTDGDGLADLYDNNDTDGPNGTSPCVGQPGCLQGVSTNPLLDTDNDGVTDNERDTDGDGLADYIDLDADNDGIPDVVEAGGTDADGDGFADDFVDVDGDGFNDLPDGEICTDSTDIGTSTFESEIGVDDETFATGQPNGTVAELYTQGDSLVLDFGVDLPVGTDYIIYWKRKAYGDDSFTSDMSVEESLSPIGGFTRHTVDPSTNSEDDIVATLLQTENPTRYIRIGILTNSNDDLEVDAAKYFYNEEQCEVGNPILVSGADTDADGEPNSYPSDDTDGDGILDYLDLDSDNDGIPDVVEVGGTDVNGDGRADNYVDTDNDGFNDVVDGDVGNDGISENTSNAQLTTGSDGNSDGIPDSYPNDDFDGDEVYNFLDLDSDDDGILDVTESGGTDTNRDGQEDAFVDADNDGFNDVVDGDIDNLLPVGDDSDGGEQANATTLTAADGDGDGVPDSVINDDFDGDELYNFLDIDADNDGIVDNTEAQPTVGYIAPDNADADGDGIDDAYDSDDANFGGVNSSFILSDIDGTENPDYLDLDSDADGDLDIIEGHDSDNDGLGDAGSPSPANTGLPGGTTDIDGDGLLDGFDNNTSSQDPTNVGLQGTSHANADKPLTVEADWREALDNDNDGITDIDDLDDDNDGILDDNECSNLYSVNFDADASADGNGSGELVDGINSLGAVSYTTSTISNSGTSFTSTWSSQNGSNEVPNIALLVEEAGVFAGTNVGAVTAITLPQKVRNPILVVNFITSAATFDFSNVSGLSSIILLDNSVGASISGKTLSFPAAPVGANSGLAVQLVGNIDLINFTTTTISASDTYGFNLLVPGCDSDGDGISNNFDLDSDNDGIPDIIEAGGTDANNDGRVDGFADGDNDGWATTFDNVGEGGTPLTDGDQDGDGFKNRLDLDADDDGLADIIEAGGVDTDNDGRADNATDGDDDGWANLFDGDNGGTVLPVPDTDGDGSLPNYLDLDSDNDGIIDNIEWQTTADFMVPSGTDANSNGWDDEYDDGPTPQAISNNDGAGDGADYIDLNSDTDSEPDWLERADDDEDGDALLDLIAIADAYEAANGNPNHYVSSDDADNDDIPDFLEDADSDGIPNFLDPDNGTFYRDTDNDGIVDLYDATQNGNNRDNVNQLGDIDNGGDYDFRDGTNDVTLPIELINFTATKVGKYVQLDWSTATEINNDYFTIQRSVDGEHFEYLLTEDGAGNSSSRKVYRRYDEQPEIGYNYYKLTQTDFNGEEEEFNIEVVKFEKVSSNSSKYKVYPNPTTGRQLFLEIDQPMAGEYKVEIMTSIGKLLDQRGFKIESETIYFEQEMVRRLSLAKGVYFLRVQVNGELEVFKFIVQ